MTSTESELSLTQVLADHARRGGVMLVDREEATSFELMLKDSSHLAAALQSLGVHSGDSVALWLPTSRAWFVGFFACARLGAIAVAVNTRFLEHELEDVLKRSNAKCVIAWPGYNRIDYCQILNRCTWKSLSHLKQIIVYSEPDDQERVLLPKNLVVSWKELVECSRTIANASDSAAPCLIFTTSGTTKAPKLVTHSQAALLKHGRDVARAHGIDDTSVVMLAPPLCGAFGLCVAMSAFAVGRPLIIAPKWAPAQAAVWIDKFNVTHVPAVDDALAQLLDQNDRTPAYPSVRLCGFGGFNPARRDLAARATRRGLCVVGMYGTSEIQGLFSNQPAGAPASVRQLGGGYPVSSGARVRVRETETGRLMGNGEQGELEVFAPASCMLGYYGDSEATKAAFTPDGWYKTGDLGYVISDNNFVYLGRLDDRLRLGGFLVSPLEIETCVQQCPGVELCQVVSVDLGEVNMVIAFVKMSDSAQFDENEILDHIASNLARYKVPSRIYSISNFPITEGANGDKIKKSELKKIARDLLNIN